MIGASDTSALIAYLAGKSGPSVDAVAELADNDALRLPPAVITEMLSHPLQGPISADFVARSPVLPLYEGYWTRAGETRRKILALGLRARLSDTLIAQACIDSDVPLVTLDNDFRHFAEYCGLKLA